MNRPRDNKGRFIKVEKPEEMIVMEDGGVREFNRVADGEPSEEKQHQQDIFVDFLQNTVGAVVFIIIGILILIAFCGCSAKEKAVYIPVVKTVEVHTIVRDTVIETELVEYYSERETRDTASYLTNPFAYSQATIIDGTLTHSLGIHPGATVAQTFPIPERTITIVDSIPYPVPVPGPTEYIEHKPSAIERFLLWVGAFAVIYFVVRATKLATRLLRNSLLG